MYMTEIKDIYQMGSLNKKLRQLIIDTYLNRIKYSYLKVGKNRIYRSIFSCSLYKTYSFEIVDENDF